MKNWKTLFKNLLLTLSILIIACNSDNEKSVTSTNQRIIGHNGKSEIEIDEQNIEKIVADFSKSYSPKQTESLNSIPNEIIMAFNKLRTINKDAHKKYVTLIFVKLYAEHLECCHQSYIIANFRNNQYDEKKLSMINEFAFMTGYLDADKLPEIWTSGIIENWIKENPNLLGDRLIKREYDKVEIISKNIADGVYWKE